MRGAASLALLIAIAGCKADEEPFVVRVVSGIGDTPFAGTPAITHVELRVRSDEGERTVGNVAVSSGSFEVPDSAKSGVGSLVLAGIGETGTVLAYGRTPSMELSGLSGVATVSLAIFAQRTQSIVPAIKVAGAFTSPICTAIGTRFGIFAKTTRTTADVLDMLDWTVAREEAFKTAPASIATAGSLLLTIDKDGVAALIDLGSGVTRTPNQPEGATFADVAFGHTVRDENGGAWIVGGTRANAPSDVAIRLGGDGAIVARKLLGARTSASATWVTGRGLFVAYGSDTLAPELLAPSATASTALPFPAEPGASGVVTATDGSHVLRVDAQGVVTTLDLTCAKECMPAASTLHDEPRTPRADDHATPIEGGGAVIVRGGRVLRLERDASALTLVQDAGGSAVCSTPLPNGSVAIAAAGDDVVRTISPAR